MLTVEDRMFNDGLHVQHLEFWKAMRRRIAVKSTACEMFRVGCFISRPFGVRTRPSGRFDW